MTTSTRADIPVTWTNRLNMILMIVMIAGIALFLVNELYDFDVWWHITIGNDILKRGAIPFQDRFAAASLGRPYHDSHWLFQVLLALSHRAAGIAGVQMVMIAVWALAFFFCHRAASRWGSPLAANILLFIAAMAATERFLPRPEIITCLMIAFFYWRLQQGKFASVADLVVMGLAQIIWANSHGLFVVGPFMAGCYWVVAAIHKLRGHHSEFSCLSRLLAVLIAATLVTPYGFDGWRYALLLFTEAGPHAPTALKIVGELSPTFGTATRAGYAFWFFAMLLTAAVITTLIQCYRRQVSVERLLIVVGFGAAAMTGRRNIVLFALVAAPFTAEQLRYLLPARPRGTKVLCLLAISAILGWSCYAQFGDYYLKQSIPYRIGFGASAAYFPLGLHEFLDRTGFRGQIFNSNSLGGYYLYQNYPQRLPLVDGRWEVYDQSVLDRINESPANPLLWSWVVSTYDIRGLLLQHASPDAQILLPKISQESRWRLVYLDHAASFWMRSDCDNLPAAIDLSAQSALPPPSANIHATLTLGRFLQSVQARELQITNLQHALGFGKKTEFLLEQLGLEQMRTGRMQEAEATFVRLNGHYPRNTTALSELAFVAASRGDLARALALLKSALDIDPNNVDYRANYLRLQQTVRGRSGR